MKNLLDYRIFPKLKLIIEICRGKVLLDEFVQFKIHQIGDKTFNPLYDVLLDLRDVDFEFNEEKFKALISILKDDRKINIERRLILFANDITTVTESIIYQHLLKPLKIKSIVITELNDVVNFIGNKNLTKEFLEKSIKEMENSIRSL